MTGLIVNIDVPDLDNARSFYQAAFGFEFQRTLFNGTVVELRFNDTAIYLIEQKDGTTAVANSAIQRSYANHWTPVHLDIVVEDLDVARAKAVAAGATPSTAVSVNDWGKLAPLRDPFGHGICLLEFTGRGYDHVAD